MNRPLYNANQWVLGQCQRCGRLNYVEPHGIDAMCKCSGLDTDHSPIPMDCRDVSGMRVIRKPEFVKGKP